MFEVRHHRVAEYVGVARSVFGRQHFTPAQTENSVIFDVTQPDRTVSSVV